MVLKGVFKCELSENKTITYTINGFLCENVSLNVEFQIKYQNKTMKPLTINLFSFLPV